MTATAADAHAPATNGAESEVNHHSHVAFMFVQEYYTFMNKDPHRLHCFYSKNSAMVHGDEGEATNPHHGQQAIHSKIMELDFQDCKVRVKNVDALSSLNGGIIIQVLGEMANKGGPSQKFSQTFFLAEQPKGYYVLNDIFRFIKDDDEDDEIQDQDQHEEDDDQEKAVLEAEPEHTLAPAVTAAAPEPAVEEPTPAPETLAAEETAAAAQAAAEPEPVQETPAPVPVAAEEKKADKKKPADKKADKKTDKREEGKEGKKESKKEEDAEKTAVATAIPEAPVDISASVPAPAPAPAEPPKPKTWANLAANNSGQWGAHASTTKGASVTVSQPAPSPSKPAASVSQHPQQHPQQSQGRPHREFHSIYVKNITDKMTLDQLREAFSQFGVVKHLELTVKKNCAFVDFATAEAVQAALKQNTVKVGNEIVLAEERRRNSGPQAGGRPFHHQNGGVNGHANGGGHRYDAKQGGPQGGAGRGGRGGSARGGPGDRKPIHRQDNKPVLAAAK